MGESSWSHDPQERALCRPESSRKRYTLFHFRLQDCYGTACTDYQIIASFTILSHVQTDVTTRVFSAPIHCLELELFVAGTQR